jgi:hypothetical protein
MKKLLMLFLLGTACTTPNTNPEDDVTQTPLTAEMGIEAPKLNAGERPEILGLEDMAFEFVEKTWGKPDFTAPDAAGGTKKVHKYRNIVTSSQDPETETEVVQVCEIEIKVDAEGLVSDWEYKNCQPRK